MKRVVTDASVRPSQRDVIASDSNKSSLTEAVSLAEALKYVLDDMSEDDYQKGVQKCPRFYGDLQDFIKYN